MVNGRAESLGRSVRTVEWHLQQAYTKLGVHDRTTLTGILPGLGTIERTRSRP